MRLSGRKPSSFTQNWPPQTQVVLVALIGANIGAFLGQVFLDVYQPGFVQDYLGLSDSGVRAAYGWQFFTAAFLHDGPWHLIGNLLILYFLGRDVESIIGQRQFFFLYVSGVGASELGHLFLMPSTSVLFAASGGVTAVLIAYAVILPELELNSGILSKLPIRIKAKYLAYGACVFAIWGVTFGRNGSVAHSAYLGGLVAGWTYAHILGFGRTSIFQRRLQQRRAEVERYETMSVDQFISEEVDPILDKISREGLHKLTWNERRILAQAQEKIAGKTQQS